MTTIILIAVGIVLAAAAALMMVFYGGDAFATGSVGAKASTVVEHMHQVKAALRLRQIQDGKVLNASQFATNAQTLSSEGWLTQIPSGIMLVDKNALREGAVSFLIYGAGNSKEGKSLCSKIEKNAGRQDYTSVARTDLPMHIQSISGYGCVRITHNGTENHVIFDRI